MRRFWVERTDGFHKKDAAGVILTHRTSRDTLEEAIGNDLHEARISPQMLMVDRFHYQRGLDQDYVEKLVDVIADDPERKKSRADLVVAVRPDDSHLLINGQHHAEAAMRLRIPLVEIYWFLSNGWRFEKTIYNRFERWQESVR